MESLHQGTNGFSAEQADPTRLGRYPLLGVISRGSMGSVYRSIDPRTSREVALKAVRRDVTEHGDGANLSARLRIEAEVGARLTHPGIVRVHEYGEDGAYAFVVMEYVEGSSLRQCIERKLEFSIGRSIDVVSQLLEALQHAHERGVWHRDVKPANILIALDGRVKLTDFGIARTAAALPGQSDIILGTPGYVAPESYVSDAFDARVDVFAAGAVLYQLLAGAPPFLGTADEVMFKVCHETPLPPSMAGGAAAVRSYDAVVLKALARRPEGRFGSAAQFREALLAVRRER